MVNTRPKIIVLRGIRNLTRSLPKGISMSSIDPGVFSSATSLVMIPLKIAKQSGHIGHKYARPHHWLQDLPETLRNIVIVFETLPDGHWPMIWASMHAYDIDDLLEDMVHIITQTNKATPDAESDASKRQWTFVNAGRIHPELVPGKQLDPGGMVAEVEERLAMKLKKVYDTEDLGDKGHQTGNDVAKRVVFKSMPDFIRRGVGWDLQARRARASIREAVVDQWRGMD